jgi:hypothetical protein
MAKEAGSPDFEIDTGCSYRISKGDALDISARQILRHQQGQGNNQYDLPKMSHFRHSLRWLKNLIRLEQGRTEMF